ncbi:MAG: glycosyltransferase family 1 protein [Patescibacteria group bacterium]
MKIGIDARMYGTSNAGLGRYIEKLIEHLEKIDLENEYVVFLLAENFDQYQPQNSNFSKVKVESRWYTLNEHWQMPKVIKKYQLELMHFPHFNVPWFCPTKYVVTIHDLIMTHYPNSRATTKLKLIYWLKVLAYRLLVKRAATKAQKIITVSQFSKDDIVKNLNVKPEKIVVTYEGFDLNQNKVGQIDLAKFGIAKPYLLYVGNAYPHKNLERLVTAFAKLVQKRELQLVLVGKRDFFSQRLEQKVNQMNLAGKIIFTGYLKDDELTGLYERAEMFVFPSLLEGFGLPPLEALGRGTVVVSSNTSCLPEILGSAVLYFNPLEIDDIINKVEQILDNQELKQTLIEKGRLQTQKYSWDECASKTLAIYRAN